MSATSKQKLGNWGEDLASKLLENKGYQVLARNWRFKRAEVDLIVQNEQFLVFVEVKVRKNANFGHPEVFVNEQKTQLIRMASEQFQINIGYNGFIRFDIISVEGNPQQFEVLHIEDAF